MRVLPILTHLIGQCGPGLASIPHSRGTWKITAISLSLKRMFSLFYPLVGRWSHFIQLVISATCVYLKLERKMQQSNPADSRELRLKSLCFYVHKMSWGTPLTMRAHLDLTRNADFTNNWKYSVLSFSLPKFLCRKFRNFIIRNKAFVYYLLSLTTEAVFPGNYTNYVIQFLHNTIFIYL